MEEAWQKIRVNSELIFVKSEYQNILIFIF